VGGAAVIAAQPPAPAAPAAIVAYHDSGQWDRDTTRASNRGRRALLAVAGAPRPAVVLDIDDTALSSYDCLHRADFDRSALTACARRGRMPAIPQIRSLYRFARGNGFTVFFVTGRREAMRSATRHNLRRRGYHGSLRITMRRDGARRGSNAQYKARARRAIEARGYAVVLNVGDQRSDLASGPSGTRVKLPNPMYLTH
jgi:predicted secreted acid phosphatase